jgi:hypothetical protein
VNNALVINEISTSSAVSSEDEFVELYNATDAEIELSGYSMTYSSASGASTTTLWIGLASETIAAKDFFVIGGFDYEGTADGGFEAMSELAQSAGLRLFDVNRAVDEVAWGNVLPSHPYIEGSPAPSATATGGSIGRVPDGMDCNDNQVDFFDLVRSPGRAN